MLARAQDLNDRQSLYDQHTLPLVKQLRPDSTLWTQHSTERLIFDVLLLESGKLTYWTMGDVAVILIVIISLYLQSYLAINGFIRFIDHTPFFKTTSEILHDLSAFQRILFHFQVEWLVRSWRRSCQCWWQTWTLTKTLKCDSSSSPCCHDCWSMLPIHWTHNKGWHRESAQMNRKS